MAFIVGPHTFTKCFLGTEPIGASAGISSLSDITHYGFGLELRPGMLVFYYNRTNNILMSIGVDDAGTIVSPHRWKPRTKGQKFDTASLIAKNSARKVRGMYVPLTTRDAHALVVPV